ncbi:MAG TPA: TonB family protein [Candidatus Dormibacteraeota bacterium]|nr:TonB family protein [Candidatus Dormibacteraeota bacterium]
MGYHALLFCPDDKTARTVTQVLSELEFNVEACLEPFAAVKKLMGQHFDAVVVDCDNEQNATLLFKSARNSTSNQTSLAVAVVEGQAGVAKAFRIGANLVLTKPINIEQAKGTLRVARGLLRKSEPAKPAAPAATAPAAPVTATAAPAKPAAPKPVAAKPAAPVKPASLPPKPVAARPPEIAVPKPATQAWPAAAASATPAAPDDDLLGIETEKPAAPVVPIEPHAPARIVADIKPSHVASSISGAASAPAPAREPQAPAIAEKSPASTADSLFEKPVEGAASEPAAYVGSAPSFTFGASAEAQSSGGNKKIFLGVAAALIVVTGAYFGFTHSKGSGGPSTPSQPAPIASTATPTPKPSGAPPMPAPAASAPVTSAPPVSKPEAAAAAPASNPDANDDGAPVKESSPHTAASSTKASASSSPAPAKTVVEDKPESNALVVKGGKAPTVSSKPAAADAPAPSVIGLAAPDAASLPNLGATPASGLTPRLQTLSISQGVSQGLLYKKVAPTYPSNALRMHIEGTVELQATISKEGAITHIKVLSGDPQLTKAASDAVKQWKYKPYLLNGEPVEIQTEVTVNFKMPH